jgi:hypothetical protein
VRAAGLPADPETGYTVPEAIVRALRPPAVPAGTCPTLPARKVDPAFGPAAGPGPVYPVGLHDGVLDVAGVGGTQQRGEYGGQKVLWVVDPAYPGPVLIRGAQLDGPADVRFWRGPNPAAQMQLPPAAASSGWRDWPSYTRVRAVGCYFWQVDGTDFSYTVVFRAHAP